MMMMMMMMITITSVQWISTKGRIAGADFS